MLGIGLDGLDELDARLTHAQRGLVDLTEPNRAAAQLAATESTRLAPKASGALAGATRPTVDATSWGLANSRPYALFVYAGTRFMRARPWLLDAATDTEDRWLTIVTDHVQQLLDTTGAGA